MCEVDMTRSRRASAESNPPPPLRGRSATRSVAGWGVATGALSIVARVFSRFAHDPPPLPPPQGGRGISFNLAVAVALALTSTAAHAQTAQEIIAASDKVRNPGQPFRATNTLTEYVSGTARN